MASNCALSPLCTASKRPLARKARASFIEASPRVAAVPPSMPMSTSFEATPVRNWSSSTACSAVGAEGRKADRSATKVVRTAMVAQAITHSSHSASACRRANAMPRAAEAINPVRSRL